MLYAAIQINRATQAGSKIKKGFPSKGVRELSNRKKNAFRIAKTKNVR
jgi:hypothetical protein